MGQEKRVPSWARAPAKRGHVHLRIDKGHDIQYVAVEGAAGYLIGRNESSCDIVCEDKTCSRVHACIAHDPAEKFYVVDLGSVQGRFPFSVLSGLRAQAVLRTEVEDGTVPLTTGTMVNGAEIAPESRAELIPGKTEFALGVCPWKFSLQRGPAPGSYASQGRERHPSRPAERDLYHQEGRLREHEVPQAETRRMSHSHRSRDVDERRHDSSDSKRRRHEPSRQPGFSRPERQDKDEQREWRGDRHHREPPRENRQERQSKFSSADPASIVRGMAALPPTAMPYTSAGQKKKLLWGNKAPASTEGSLAEGGGAGGAFGANRWDQAQFGNEADRQKFIKLMGAGSAAPSDPAAEASQGQNLEREGALAADQQSRVFGDVESHFMQGLRRADGRKVGLGL